MWNASIHKNCSKFFNFSMFKNQNLWHNRLECLDLKNQQYRECQPFSNSAALFGKNYKISHPRLHCHACNAIHIRPHKRREICRNFYSKVPHRKEIKSSSPFQVQMHRFQKEEKNTKWYKYLLRIKYRRNGNVDRLWFLCGQKGLLMNIRDFYNFKAERICQVTRALLFVLV